MTLAPEAPSAPALDWRTYLARAEARWPGLLLSPEGRRVLTRLDPLLFALVYMRHHLKDADGNISLSEFHIDICEMAKGWVVPSEVPEADRDAIISPRESGKSTWFFLILPTWAAAHGHRMFAAAFADASEQAERHLKTFKAELDQNELLRRDYPDLCSPLKRRSGQTAADTQNMYQSKSGFVFGAKGCDASALGMKVGPRRPDLIILDDIEPGGGSYSAGQKEKRLKTVVDDIFPMNIRAQVVIVGTVTMPGSIIHDLVKHGAGEDDAPEWPRDENIRVHHYKALIEDPEPRSLWPEKWSLEYLLKRRHTRSFRKNLQNDPMAADGQYWTDDDFIIGQVPGLTAQMISIDPAVTSTAKSDYTGIAVIGYNKSLGRCVVRGAWQVKVQPGRELRDKVQEIAARFPGTAGILVETNQGGAAWRSILGGLGMRVREVHNSQNKTTRATNLLEHYQNGRVFHETRMAVLEEQMIAFPRGSNDDVIDAVGNGVQHFLRPGIKRHKPSTIQRYM
ncbi:hypothetical protein ACFQH9_02080 [Pseudonocardia lutea]|uniref:Terminase large subunit gp17-like C-terminal domain-containing protein n=1 Tax=Pseudonocardia lutea TaxID=2172015 RepID=A0ABW1I120_9PSEU